MRKCTLSIAAGSGLVFLSASLTMAQPATNAVSAEYSAATVPSMENRPFGKNNESVEFCGETLPVDYPAVTERWNRTVGHQATMVASLLVLKRRASVVFPLIEPILKQYRIPADFKFLPLLESAVINRAVSRRGAAGFWQLMPQTAQSLGLTVSRHHDERFDLRKATHAACRYLNELYSQLGSWMLVASAYNAGPTYIAQLARQHPALHPMALPYRAAETKAYLFQTMAIKELLTHPQAYGSYLDSRHVATLSDNSAFMPSAERMAILASFGMDEKMAFVDGLSGNETPAFVADSTTAVVLLTDSEPTIETPAQVVSLPETAGLVSLRLVTRSLSEGALTEGKRCLFQVVQPLDLNGLHFAVGDVIQAHIEVIDTVSGRVFLRTDRHTTAWSQETVALNFVATGDPRQPGVGLPNRLENWWLTWESL